MKGLVGYPACSSASSTTVYLADTRDTAVGPRKGTMHKITGQRFGVALLAVALAATSGMVSAEPAAPNAAVDEPGGPVQEATAIDAALDYLSGASFEQLPTVPGVAASTPPVIGRDDLAVSAVVPTEHNGTSNVHVQQQLNGIDIRGAVANVTIGTNGDVLYAPSRHIPGAAVAASGDTSGSSPTSPTLSGREALDAAVAILDLTPTGTFNVIRAEDDAAQNREFTDGGVSRSPIPARLIYEPMADGSLRLAWELLIDSTATNDWWRIRIDADTGAELSRYNLVIHESHGDHDGHDAHDIGGAPSGSDAALPPVVGSQLIPVVDGSSYSVFPQPNESPSHTSPADTRTVVNNPADKPASPFGWHDTDGKIGPESTLTRGNNVTAGTDLNADDVLDPGSQPDGGAGLDFTPPLDLAGKPSTYVPASVVNLFYWNNIAHDFLYAYGFDEKAGNFQTNNYGKGGAGGDAVIAESQDGYGQAPSADPENQNRDNANFATPPDGRAPRMQMFVWCGFDGTACTTPERDSSLDAGVVVHEYAHGLSTRLTGGPVFDECLANEEQMGEGWSDIVALLATMKGGMLSDRTRGIFTYARDESTTAAGERSLLEPDPGTPGSYMSVHRPYSTTFGSGSGENNWTYALLPRTTTPIDDQPSPHAHGAIWAQMLWEMTWALIDEVGFDPDLARGTGGNNIAMKLILDGMKMQPCSPGFIDGRNAILQADAVNYDGAYSCAIWKAFAKRGLGVNASQGSPDSRVDGTAGFNVPNLLCDTLAVAAPASAGPDSVIEYELNASSPFGYANVEIKTPIPSDTTYVAGSADCGGTVSAGVLTQTVLSIDPNVSDTCKFSVRTSTTRYGQRLLYDDFSRDRVFWTTAQTGGADGWAVTEGTTGVGFANATDVTTDQFLTLRMPFRATADTQLTFVNIYEDLEKDPDGKNFDGGVVEASTDGGTTWIDIGTKATKNGYNGTIETGTGSTIAGRQAFTGTVAKGKTDTAIDLGSLVGKDVLLRFRLASDEAGASEDALWIIDDVKVTIPEKSVAITSTLTADFATASGSARTRIELAPPPDPDPLPPPSDPDPDPDPDPPAVAKTVFSPLTPARLRDTRPTKSTVDGLELGPDKVAAGSTTTVQVAGRGKVPVAQGGAILNVTAIQPEGAGFFTVYPCSPTRPLASSLNFAAGENLGNEIIAATSSTGTVCIYSSVKAHIAVDVVGYLPPDSAYGTLPPARLMDTRANGETIDTTAQRIGKRQAGTQFDLPVRGRAGVPADAASVIVNITAIQPESVGFITAHACLPARPNASSLNYTPGTNRGNEVVVELSSAGTVCLYTSATTGLAVDIVGYLPATTSLSAVAPSRLLDTRTNGKTIDNLGLGGGPRPSQSSTVLQVTGRAGVPASAGVVLINITAVNPAGVGFITVWPCNVGRPNTSSLNYRAGVNGGNDLIAGLGTDGNLCIFNSESTQITVDVTAYGT